MDRLTLKQLFLLPNVVGVGFGYKETAGMETNQDCLTVLVSKKLPPHQLRPSHVVPKSIDSLHTDVIEVGHLKVHKSNQPAPEPSAVNPQSLVRPSPPGVSIAHYRATTGTFGALVYDNATGQPLLLSNNHIFANSSTGRDFRARINDPILQPGPLDGGITYRATIAKLKRFVPLSALNEVDCAVAEPLSSDLVLSEILEIGVPTGITAPKLQQAVKKFGRTTGLTFGSIKTLDVTAKVNYGGGRTLLFEHQILTTRMSSPGDSGSLVVDMQNQAVGLLFASSDTVTMLNPIQSVLDKLNVYL